MARTDQTGTAETDGAVGTKGKPTPPPVPAVQPDTTEAGRVAASGWKSTPTAVTGTRDTLTSTVVDKYPPYKPPSGPVPGVVKDTTLTDLPVGNGTGSNAPNPALSMTGTLETAAWGAAPMGTKDVPLPPAAPTATAGDRHILVSWAPVPNPTGAPVQQYVIESDTGGHVYAGADKTSAKVENVTGGQGYKFRVRAGNRNGSGPYSAWSASAVAPGNEDEVRPTSLAPDNTTNPIYRQDGSVVPGSYGAPTAPGKPSVAAVSGSTGKAKISWTASKPKPSSYLVRMSSGQSATVTAEQLQAEISGLEVDAVVTATVTAVGVLQSATSAASDPYTVT